MSTYEISKSSLLSLKAEILKKQDELNKAKLENAIKIRNLKKLSPLDLKNKGVEQRQQNQDSTEVEDLLRKSRETLEAKSLLYEKLSKDHQDLSPQQIEYYQRYLVRFDKKAKDHFYPPEAEGYDDRINSDEDYPCDEYDLPTNPDDEWVEYVDCLGRTRTCLRKDLSYLKSKDKDLQLIVDEKRRNRSKSKSPPPPPKQRSKTPEPKPTEENELLSSDMQREMLRQQWEKEEEELRKKSDVHYQDVLFNEARTHGVGYYNFSTDEKQRHKQQEALKNLRNETKQQQKKSQDLKAMREKQLAARIRAAKNRKRERMGLPPLEENEPEPVIPTPEPKEEEPEKRDEMEKKLEKMRKKHVRPWDIGKEGVKEYYKYSQEEWVDKKRKERTSEFAPPSSYQKNRHRKEYQRRDSKPTPIDSESSSDEYDSRNKGVEIEPPCSYDYNAPSQAKRSRSTSVFSDVSESVEAGLRYLREELERKQKTSHRDLLSSQ